MQRQKWLFEITPNTSFFNLNFKEIWQYRDLLVLFVRRDILTLYKQTILGPFWYLIQPLFTSLIFTLVFNNIAGISTGSTPPFLFNLAGVTIWNYFNDCIRSTSDTFKKNEAIFGKVYFPRVIVPLSIVISNLLKFIIQFFIFICFYFYFYLSDLAKFPNIYIIFLPLLILIMGMIGLGIGMIISSLVTKYKDLSHLVDFSLQILMYLSAVMYPLELMREKLSHFQGIFNFSFLVDLNPLAHLIEFGRFILLNEGNYSMYGVIYSGIITIVIFIFGLLLFNKTENSFIDTI